MIIRAPVPDAGMMGASTDTRSTWPPPPWNTPSIGATSA
jgi:hypothetical protein